jgi:hypothetical protein
LYFTVYTDVTATDNVTAGEWLGVPWPSDNAEHFEVGNLTSNCTATDGSNSMCDGNRLVVPSFCSVYVSRYREELMGSMEENCSLEDNSHSGSQ